MIHRSLLFLFAALLPLAADYRHQAIEVTSNGRAGTLHCYHFDSREEGIQVIERGRFQKLADAMRAHNCVAGCNGGFFDPNYKPLGQVVASGKVSGQRNLVSSLTSGVLYQDGNTIAIERAQAYYSKERTPSQLLQTGPFLIENGQPVAGLSSRKFARRTLIATDGKNQWFIAYTPPITLAHLAQVLSQAKEKYGFSVQTALNLDGGSSSALWVDMGKGKNPFYLREFKPVANYLGIVSHQKN